MELKSRRRDVAIYLLVMILGGFICGGLYLWLISSAYGWMGINWGKIMIGYLILILPNIYHIYVMYYAFEDYNKVCSRRREDEELKTPSFWIVFGLGIITFGIYTYYWFYKYGYHMYELGQRRRVAIKDKGSTYLKMFLIPMAVLISLLIIFVIICVCAGMSAASYDVYSYFGSRNALSGLVGAGVGLVICSILITIAIIVVAVMTPVTWGKWLRNLNLLTESDTVPEMRPWDDPLPPQPPRPVPPVYTPPQPPKPTPPIYIPPEDHTTQTVGSVMILTGQYKNAMIPVKEGEEIILGRDSSKCHLIFENTHVSRVHCGVQYRRRENVYLITDYSTNGTFLKNGQQLVKNRPTACRRGTIVLLGKSGEQFIVR